MDSKLKKSIIYIYILVNIIIFTNIYIDHEKIYNYEIYFNGKSIGCYGDLPSSKEVCESITSDINNVLISDEIQDGSFSYSKDNSNSNIKNIYGIRDSIVSSINSEGVLTKIYINNKSYGLILNENDGKNLLKRVGELFIENNKISRDNILSVDVKANIKYEKVKDKVRNVNTIDDIASNILSEENISELVNIGILCREKRLDKVAPSTVIKRRDDMYIGESISEDGVEGSKEVISDVFYKNGVKQHEKIIEEKVLTDSVDSIIYRGIKNPIMDEVAFLGSPTRGGYITSNFGPRWGSKHYGMDISGNIGDPVYAAIDGEIKECKYDGNYGNKILIQHNGEIQTIYGHLSKYEVNVGDNIVKGQLIGRVGNTGRSTGPHLHFEVRVNGSPVDPEKYLLN